MPVYYYANDAVTPIGSMTPVPTTLSDGSVGDTSTGPTEASDADSYAGDACSAPDITVTAVQRIVWDGEMLWDITAISVTGRARHAGDLPFAACISPPGTSTIENTSVLDYSTDGTNWTTIRTDNPASGSFVTYTSSTPITARYVRRTLASSETLQHQSTPLGSVYAYAQNTDFRITGTEAEIGDVVIEPDPEEEETDEGRCGISLAWNEVEDATLYDLQRRRPSSDWSTLYSGVVNSYEDTTAQVGQDYYYRARARNGDTIGDWSEVLVLSNVCEAQWSISPLPEAADYDRNCAPAPRTWGKSR